MALCPTCTYWAREFASLDEHHPACPHHPSATPMFPEAVMPGPVSDAHDPEFGTAAEADAIREALAEEYARVGAILNHQPPAYIGELIHWPPGPTISEALSEKSWRLIRFALERAIESI